MTVLNTIKQMLGLESDDDSFDVEVLVNINSFLIYLCEIGIFTNCLEIKNDTNWDDLSNDDLICGALKNYLYQRVKLIFDPPAASTAIDCFKNSISELEWRMQTLVERKEDFTSV